MYTISQKFGCIESLLPTLKTTNEASLIFETDETVLKMHDHVEHVMDMHCRIASPFPRVIRESETDIQSNTSKLLTGTEHQKAEKTTLSRT